MLYVSHYMCCHPPCVQRTSILQCSGNHACRARSTHERIQQAGDATCRTYTDWRRCHDTQHTGRYTARQCSAGNSAILYMQCVYQVYSDLTRDNSLATGSTNITKMSTNPTNKTTRRNKPHHSNVYRRLEVGLRLAKRASILKLRIYTISAY